MRDGMKYYGIKIIWASSGPDLLQKALHAFELPSPPIQIDGKYSIYLWSAPIGTCNRIRIDNLTVIPKEITDIWIRYGNI